MLRRAVDWMHHQKPQAIITRLEIADAQERRDCMAALARLPEMFPPDVRFSRSQIEATREFLRAAGDHTAAAFDAQRLINDRWAGNRP